MAKFRAICLILIAGNLAGCASCPGHADIILPHRPLLQDVQPGAVWDAVPLEAKEIWIGNDLELKTYARRLEERIRIHNELAE